MKVIKSKRKENIVSLEIEEDHSKLDACMDKAFHKVKKHAKIPGFRPGKITRVIFEKNYGKGPLMEEALGFLTNDAYKDAITELKLDVVDYPQNVDFTTYKEDKPIRFTLDVEVEPIVKLGKYKGVKVVKEPTTVTDEDLQAELDKLRENHAEYNEVTREAKDEDILRFNLKATIDGVAYEQWTRENSGARIGAAYYGPEFDVEVTGLKTGAQKAFTVAYPDDFNIPEVAGKTVDFDIEISEIREKQLPELTEEIVEKISGEKKDVALFKTEIKGNLQETRDKESETKLKEAIITEVTNNVTITIPEAMIQREMDMAMHQMEHNLKHSGLTLEQYAQFTQKTMDDIRNETREAAQLRVKSTLVLKEVAQKEKIEPSNEDIEATLAKWNIKDINTVADLEKSPQYDLDNVKAAIKEEKVIELLVSTAKVK
ncbi:trigger factor [bacterium]|jgi:trigger factor|nr:trigger factor [bacterium]